MTPEGEDAFGWENWLLLCVLFLALVVVPALIILRPPTGVSLRFAYLVLPTIAAIGLALIAVWAAVRSA